MSALLSQHEAWVAARARMGAPVVRPRPPRAVHPLWVPSVPLLPPPEPDWTTKPAAPYDEYVEPPPVAKPEPFRWREIIEEVARKHGFFMAEMRSIRRGWPLVAARHEAMWRLRNETSMSLPEIGRRMGGRDHTTVIHGIRKHEQRIANGTAK